MKGDKQNNHPPQKNTRRNKNENEKNENGVFILFLKRKGGRWLTDSGLDVILAFHDAPLTGTGRLGSFPTYQGWPGRQEWLSGFCS